MKMSFERLACVKDNARSGSIQSSDERGRNPRAPIYSIKQHMWLTNEQQFIETDTPSIEYMINHQLKNVHVQ